MIVCDHCRGEIPHHDPHQKDFHPFCQKTLVMGSLVVEFAHYCDQEGSVPFSDLMLRWLERYSLETKDAASLLQELMHGLSDT
jgi:hypothetical protein